MQQRCLEVVHVHAVGGEIVAVGVALAVGEARADAAAGHPDRETAGVMVAAEVVVREFALAIIRAAEFAAPHHQCLFQQTATIQITNQRG